MDNEEQVKNYLNSQLSLLTDRIDTLLGISWNGNPNVPLVVGGLTEMLRSSIDAVDSVIKEIKAEGTEVS